MASTTAPPVPEPALTEVLNDLAQLDAMLNSLFYEFTRPLTDEEIAAGAEARTPAEIAADLQAASRLVSTIALIHLKVSPDRWQDVVLAIE